MGLSGPLEFQRDVARVAAEIRLPGEFDDPVRNQALQERSQERGIQADIQRQQKRDASARKSAQEMPRSVKSDRSRGDGPNVGDDSFGVGVERGPDIKD